MPAALWLIALPLGAAPIIYLLRRVGIGAIAAAIVAAVSAWLVVRTPTGLIFDFLGRSVELDSLSQGALVLLFVAAGILFLISSAAVPLLEGVRRTTVDTGILTGAGRTFYPLSLAVLGLLVAANLSRQLAITTILVGAAGIVAVFIIQGARIETTRAAQRFLIFISLSIPILLLVAWRVDFYEFSNRTLTSIDLRQMVLMVGLGFALWLAVVPFHGWLTTTAVDASPASAAFILIAFPAIAIIALLRLFLEAPWLVTSSSLPSAMVIAGLVTACIGGGLTAVQRGFSGLMGYAALFDLGATLIVFGSGAPATVLIVMVALAVRALALTVIAASISAIRLQITDDGFAQAAGLAYRMPVATLGLLIGGFTLAGMPPTIGFAVHWQVTQSIADLNTKWTVFLVLAGLGVATGYLRGAIALLFSTADRDTAAQDTDRETVITIHEPPLLLVIITGLGVACLMLGIYPQILIDLFRELTTGYEIF